MIYGKIKEHKRDGLNRNQVKRRLNIDYKTVDKYWDMSPEDYASTREKSKSRKRKADKYRSYALNCLRKYPDMSAAQIYDWIKEKTGQLTLEFKQRAFRSYISLLREEYDIKKPVTTRQYEAVEDPPLGHQAQVDMGEIKLETPSGRFKKYYCFAMVLSNSRHKFAVWQEKPFTTESLVQAHIQAFKFYGGKPTEIVYDQDKILAVSENNGDIIYTDGFQNFLNEMKFNVFLCHGYDPESKGRVENVVKYVKHGFAKHRVVRDINTFNEDCISWLKRTGNAELHGTTKKIPAEVFAIEKEYLQPVPTYSFTAATNNNITYQVRKDNIVLYKGNRYRVPKGTYSPGKCVFMVIDEEENISITDAITGEIYVVHPLCFSKGKLIGSKNRSTEKSEKITELENKLFILFDDHSLLAPFLNRIHSEKARYYRDQLNVIKKLFDEWKLDLIIKGLEYCTNRELYSAGDLKSSIIYLNESNKDKSVSKISESMLPSKYRGGNPEVRDLSEYENAMQVGGCQ